MINRSTVDTNILFSALLNTNSRIKILHHKVIPPKLYQKAEKLCHSIDLDDTPFIAITEYTQSKLWTGDKALINGLTKKGYDRVISTDDLFTDFLSKKKSGI